MANYQNIPSICQIAILAPLGGPSCNFPPKISQSEKHSSEVAVWHKWRHWGCKWRPHQVWESTPCRHGDIGRPNGDLGVKWEDFGRELDEEISVDWGSKNHTTRQPVSLPLFWYRNRPKVGRFGWSSGQRRSRV